VFLTGAFIKRIGAQPRAAGAGLVIFVRHWTRLVGCSALLGVTYGRSVAPLTEPLTPVACTTSNRQSGRHPTGCIQARSGGASPRLEGLCGSHAPASRGKLRVGPR
jgi:hypothetical protein